MSCIVNEDGSGSCCAPPQFDGDTNNCSHWGADGQPIDKNPIDSSPSGFTRGKFNWRKATGVVLILALVGYAIK